jgi:hypothetical protein
MKFNPVSNNLYSDDGDFLKTLYCPKNLSRVELLQSNSPNINYCKLCNETVLDTSSLSDAIVSEILKRDRDQCVLLTLEQDNISVILNDL